MACLVLISFVSRFVDWFFTPPLLPTLYDTSHVFGYSSFIDRGSLPPSVPFGLFFIPPSSPPYLIFHFFFSSITLTPSLSIIDILVLATLHLNMYPRMRVRSLPTRD